MDILDYLRDALEYAQEALVGKWTRWIILIICLFIFPVMYGYMIRIMRGITPAPEIDDYARLFVDGIKFFLIICAYLIIPMLILFASVVGGVIGFTRVEGISIAMISAAAGGIVVFILLSFFMSLFSTIGMVRFARTERMREAFNIGEIIATIGRIGWIEYIFALVVLTVTLFLTQVVVSCIPPIGPVLLLLIYPFFPIITARFWSQLYDQGAE